jgi:tetratricopeptide (TPR) repeat protein
MSLIREALKKAAGETENPVPLPSGGGGGEKKGGAAVPLKKMGLGILLLIGLIGVLLYSFFPGSLPFTKAPPPALKSTAKNIEIKTPESTPAQGKELSQVKVSEKIETKDPQSNPVPVKKFPEQGPIKSSEKILKDVPKEVPRQFISPRSTPRIIQRPYSPRSPETKSRPPAVTPKPSPPASAAQEEIDSLQLVRQFNEAVRDQEKGRWPQAIQSYQKVLVLRPHHWETYNNLGLIYQEQKRFDEALEMFRKALSLNPRYLKGFNNLGLYYLNLGKLEEAGNQFRKALDLDPSFLPASINLAVVLNRQGQVEQARKVLLKVLEYDSDNLEAHYNLGLFWEGQGVEGKALEHYKKFIAKAQGPYSALAEELKKRWPELK